MGRSSGGSSGGGGGSFQRDARDSVSGPSGNWNGNSGGGGSGLGLTTGKTWYGNTAYGPAGGTAAGYATRSPTNTNGRVEAGSSYGNPGAGGGASQGTYGNFRDPSGGAMFSGGPGAPGGVGVNAQNAIQAMMMARAMQQRVPKRDRVAPAGGLLDDPGLDEGLGKPNMFITPPVAPDWGALRKDQVRALFGSAPDGAYGPRRSTIQNLTGAFGNSFYGNPRYGTPGFSTGLGQYAGGGGSVHYKDAPGNSGPGSTHYQNGSTHYKTAF